MEDDPMPAYSGLWNGIHGQAYNNMPKSDALPPVQRGIVRALMQGRGMHGHVTALGRNAPATIARVDAELDDINVRGEFKYDIWKADPTDPAQQETMVLTNAAAHAADADQAVNESIARPTNATEADMAHTYDTTLRNGHPADIAASGSTSPAVAEAISDGT